MSDEPGVWRVVARRSVANREPWLHLWEEDVQLPDGRVIPGFNIIEMPDAVIIVAVTDDGRVIVERAYKHGPRRVCLGLPAGYIEAGEEPLLAAQRELREETGYEAREWFSLGVFLRDGNRGCGSVHLFLARGAVQTTEANAGDLEAIVVFTMPFAALLKAARRGDVPLLDIVAAISLAALHLRAVT